MRDKNRFLCSDTWQLWCNEIDPTWQTGAMWFLDPKNIIFIIISIFLQIYD